MTPKMPPLPSPVKREAGRSGGKQLLVYRPHGLLGGTFVCSRCGAAALHPDLLTHARDCVYLGDPRDPEPG